MEKEFSKTKIVLATVVGISFLAMVSLFMISIIRNPIGKNRNTSQQNQIQIKTTDPEEPKVEEQKNVDEMEFSDPGTDEIGQEVKALDDLVNETMPSDYEEESLSDETIDGSIQLQ